MDYNYGLQYGSKLQIAISDPDKGLRFQIRITDCNYRHELHIAITDCNYRSGWRITITDSDYESGLQIRIHDGLTKIYNIILWTIFSGDKIKNNNFALWLWLLDDGICRKGGHVCPLDILKLRSCIPSWLSSHPVPIIYYLGWVCPVWLLIQLA